MCRPSHALAASWVHSTLENFVSIECYLAPLSSWFSNLASTACPSVNFKKSFNFLFNSLVSNKKKLFTTCDLLWLKRQLF